MRKWRAEQGEGEEVGPEVRVAGRIMLLRDKGKLVFITLRDWSGEIQIFIGLNQVGEQNFELASLFDIGRFDRRRRTIGTNQHRRVTVFASEADIPHQDVGTCAGQACRDDRPRTASTFALR